MNGSLVSPATRQRIRDLATPIARGLGRLGVTPNELTVLGFLGSCLAAVFAARTDWILAGLLVLGFGAFDLLDGSLARATGRTSRFGAFLDSTFDRAGEAAVYLGIAFGLQSTGLGNHFLLAAIAMAAAFMVSYTRAKAESLGFATGTGMAAIGLMPREVRIVILTVGLVAAGVLGTSTAGGAFPPGVLAIDAALVVIIVGATVTTIQRILHVRAQSREG